MDFNHSIPQSFAARQPLEMHNFMSISDSMLHGNQEIEEMENSRFMSQLDQNMQDFWRERIMEICEDATDAPSVHPLPLARIKKVMKSDEKVKMISADTPVVLAKACEVLIMELTLRAWMNTKEKKRRTLQRDDVAKAIRSDDQLLCLKDIVPMEVHQEAEPEGCPVTTDDQHLMNLQYPSFFTRITQEMQEESYSRSPPPLPPADDHNQSLGFMNFFQ